MSELRRQVGSMALVVLVAAAPAWSQEVTAEHDFRGSNFDEKLLTYAGADAAKYLKPEEEGLRMRFSAGEAPKDPVGIAWRTRVIGDFVATVHYEILRNDAPKRGSGVGIESYLMLDNPERDGIAFARLNTPQSGLLVTFNHLSNNEQGKRFTRLHKRLFTTEASKRGRLRLTRTGKELVASSADGDDDEFKEIARTNIGDADLRLVRIAALAGRDPDATLDLRILDAQLKGDLPGFDGVKVRSSKRVPAGDAPDDGEPERRPPWFLLGGLLLMLGLGFVFVAVFLFIWLRRPKAKTAARVELKSAADKPELPASKVTLSCSACGQKIKVKETLAGKHVKCPGCGQIVQVPAAEEQT